MAKPFKIFLWIVGIFVALIVVATIALPLIINPNHYKPQVTKGVHDATGRELSINGDIKLTIFPWLGLSVSDVVLGNAKGFGPEPFAQVKDMNVGVRLMPLLHKEVQVDVIRIDGLALNLAKAADGTSNWADLSQPSQEKEKTQTEVSHETGKPIALTVGGLAIKNASLSYTDKQSGAAYKVDKLSVDTGAVELGKPIDVTIGFIVNSAKPPLESDVKIKFTAQADLDNNAYTVKDLKVDSTTKGASVPGGEQKASLRGNALYDGKHGTFAFTDGLLEAAGLKVEAAVNGEGLATDAPKLTGKVSSNTFSPKDLASKFGVALPPTADKNALTQASFAAAIAGSTKSARLENIQLKLDQTTATGTVAIKDFATQAIDFALKADSFDADRYLAPAGAGGKDEKTGGSSGDFKKTEIPVELLDSLNMTGTVQLATLKLKGMTMSDIKVVVDAPKGAEKTEQMTAMLYGGKITQSARYTHHSPAHYDVKMGLDAVNSAPLLKDLLGKSYLSGLGNMNLAVSSGGTTVGDFLKALSGSVATSFKNGAVEGFNLEDTISRAKALYAGQQLAPSSEPKRTPFNDLKATGKIVDGILKTDSLDMKGSWYQLGGAGNVNLVEQTLDYVITPTVSGEKYKDLAGTKIPIKVTGSWFDPSVKVDLGSVLKGRAQQEVQKQQQKLEEKAKSKFGDFLNKQLGGQKQPPAPQPAPKQDSPPPSQ